MGWFVNLFTPHAPPSGLASKLEEAQERNARATDRLERIIASDPVFNAVQSITR